MNERWRRDSQFYGALLRSAWRSMVDSVAIGIGVFEVCNGAGKDRIEGENEDEAVFLDETEN